MSDNKKDSNSFNIDAYKHAIGMIESNGGKLLETGINPETGKHWSSAAGKYHFLYESIKNDPEMKGISKRQFINNPKLQERIMDKALNGNLAEYTYGTGYAAKLKREFNSDLSINDLTAMTHFLGAGDVREWLKNPRDFKVKGGNNATAEQYLNRFRDNFKKYVPSEPVAPNSQPSRNEIIESNKPSIVTPPAPAPVPQEQQRTRATIQPRQPRPSGLKFLTEMVDKPDSNEFDAGGNITGLSGAQELVNIFEGGGTHEENPHGGIPLGIGSNGKQNLVEEGETKWNDYIFSNSISMNGVFTDSNGGQSNVFDKGGKTTKKKEITRSGIGTSLLRDALPVPQNAAQLGASMVTSDSKYSTEDSNNNVNEHLYRSVRNAMKRNKGKDGGTEYEDYSADVAKDLNGLSMKSPEMIAASALSPELTAATTFGRVSYKTNPETGDVEIYDSYDFSKTGNIGGAYGKIRKLAGDASQGRLDSKPKLIGRFNDKTGKSWSDKLNNFVEDVRNPIDAMDIEYSTIKNASKIPNQIGDAIYDTGVSAYNTGKKWINKAVNSFEEGGKIDPYQKTRDSILDANKHVPFVDRVLNPEKNKDRGVHVEGTEEGSLSSHYTTVSSDEKYHYVHPTVFDTGKKKLEYKGDKSYDHAMDTNNYVRFDKIDDAIKFSKNYKTRKFKNSTRRGFNPSLRRGVRLKQE